VDDRPEIKRPGKREGRPKEKEKSERPAEKTPTESIAHVRYERGRWVLQTKKIVKRRRTNGKGALLLRNAWLGKPGKEN